MDECVLYWLVTPHYEHACVLFHYDLPPDRLECLRYVSSSISSLTNQCNKSYFETHLHDYINAALHMSHVFITLTCSLCNPTLTATYKQFINEPLFQLRCVRLSTVIDELQQIKFPVVSTHNRSSFKSSICNSIELPGHSFHYVRSIIAVWIFEEL